MTGCNQRVVLSSSERGKVSGAQGVDGPTVHCTAGGSNSNSMSSKRNKVVQAVCRPVSRGSRHCINVLKELLPREVIHEIHQQVSSGVQPLQAVEKVVQQRMGTQAAADVTKLLMSLHLASSAGGGVVRATKVLLCGLARPLFLRGPMRVLTNVLLPTPVAGGLLGCCLVLHTARELLRNGSQQQHQQLQDLTDAHATAVESATGCCSPANSKGHSAAPVAGIAEKSAAAGSSADAAGTTGQPAEQHEKAGGKSSWWTFWQAADAGPTAAADAGPTAAADAGPTAAADAGPTAAADAEPTAAADAPAGDGDSLCQEEQEHGPTEATSHTAGKDNTGKHTAPPSAAAKGPAAGLSPTGPVTPDLAVGGPHSKGHPSGAFTSGGQPAAAPPNTQDAAAAAAEGSSPFGQQQQEAVAAAAAGPQSLSVSVSPAHQAVSHAVSGCSLFDLDSCDSEEITDDIISGIITQDVNNVTSHNIQGSTTRPAALPLNPSRAAAAAAAAAAGGGAAAAAGGSVAAAASAGTPQAPTSPVSHQLLMRQRSSSGLDDGSTSASVCSLSPTSSAPHSPREEIQGQAAEMHRRWSMGHHNEMIPEARSFKMVQQQPYRPPVFTRLSSGRAGCRITAAAAAASAREQFAARQQQRQLESGTRAGGDGGSGEDLRRFHSLDIHHIGQLLPSDQQQGAGLAHTVSAAASLGTVTAVDESPSAPLPPLPTTSSKELVTSPRLSLQSQGSGAEELQQLLRAGFVKHRSLDWGHKLCNPDAA